MNIEKEDVFSVAQRILKRIEALLGTPGGKAILAKLRNSIGSPFDKTVDVWPIILPDLPENFLGYGARISHEEKAVLVSLQLYALHQQGAGKSVLSADAKNTVADALAKLRNSDNATSVDRRFNMMITATTFEEFVHYLKQFIQLLKAKAPDIPISYARLAKDLYWLSKSGPEAIRLSWARSYYRQQTKGDSNNEN